MDSFFSRAWDTDEESRSEWGEFLIDWSGQWQCSRELSYVMGSYSETEFDPQGSKPGTQQRAELVTEWQQRSQVEYWRRLAEYHVLCFDEWEDAVRQRIETDDDATLSIRGFSERLLKWQRFTNAGEEVKQRIRGKLTDEISVNRQLGNLVIELRVSRGASLKKIAEEARLVKINVGIARDWLDEATKDRHLWRK